MSLEARSEPAPFLDDFSFPLVGLSLDFFGFRLASPFDSLALAATGSMVALLMLLPV